jgi:WD40 repeat protein
MKKLILFLMIFAFYLSYSTELRIVSPNGGENFPKGGSIDIKWAGIPDTTVVSIEYSTNKGISWSIISDSAKGLKYTWNNIPNIESNQCLLKIRELKVDFSHSYILEHTIQTYTKLMALKWSPAGDRLLAVNPKHENDSLWIWDVSTGNKLLNLKISEDNFHEVFWSPEGKQLATIVNDFNVKIWDSNTGAEIADLGTKDFPQHVQWSPDGKRLVVGFDQGLRLYSPVTWALATEAMLDDNYFYNPTFIWSPDSKKLITIAPDSIYIINPVNLQVIDKLECGFSEWRWQWYSDWDWGWGWGWGNNHKSGWCYNYYNHEGNKLAIPAKDSTIKVMDIRDGSICYSFPWYEKYYDYFCWSSDDSKIITIGYNNYLHVWNASNGLLISKYPKIESRHGFNLNPDGIKAATDNRDYSIQIWDITDGYPLQTLAGHEDEVIDYEWSPDGKRIATSSEDKTIKIWYLEDTFFRQDISDNLWSISNPEITSTDIDIGKVLINTSKDSVVREFITNSGKCFNTIRDIYLDGTDKNMFKIMPGNFLKVVQPGEIIPVEFTFRPSSVGKKSADVVIVSFADTVRQKITGEGVYPEIILVNNEIDFGQVMVSKSRDSLILLLHNKSPQQIRMDSLKLSGINSIHFEIPNNIPFFINSNEKKIIWLRFKPEVVGSINGELSCYFNGPDSPLLVNLKGEGIESNPKIQAGNISFESLICEQHTQSSIPLSNSGMKELVVYHAEITGTNDNDFKIIPVFSQMTIPPGETINLNIIFKPTGTGKRNADLILKSNSSIDSVLSIPLTSVKDSVALLPEELIIDLGYLCPDETKDTLITIRNSGTIQTSGYAFPTDGLSVADPGFIIETGNTLTKPFRFAGKTNEGKFNEVITITDSICGYTRTVEITGEVSLPNVEVETSEFKTLKGKYVDKTVKITNTGEREIIIQNPPAFSPPFELIDNPFPLIIPAGESKEFTVRFTATDTLKTEFNFNVHAEPCGVETGFTLTGTGVIARARLRAGDAEGYAGDIVEIPVYLDGAENISMTSSTKFNTDLLFNSTLLSPKSHPQNLLNDNTGSVALKDLPLTGIAGEEIARIKFIAGLGNAEYSPVYFSNIEADGGDIDFDTVGGSFRLLGVCKEGGSRLINNTGTGQLISVKPNPAEETIEIELELNEAGENRLYISDLLGCEVKKILYGNLNKYGYRKLTINISDIASGIYLVVLQTPTGRQSVMMLKK